MKKIEYKAYQLVDGVNQTAFLEDYKVGDIAEAQRSRVARRTRYMKQETAIVAPLNRADLLLVPDAITHLSLLFHVSLDQLGDDLDARFAKLIIDLSNQFGATSTNTIALILSYLMENVEKKPLLSTRYAIVEGLNEFLFTTQLADLPEMHSLFALVQPLRLSHFVRLECAEGGQKILPNVHHSLTVADVQKQKQSSFVHNIVARGSQNMAQAIVAICNSELSLMTEAGFSDDLKKIVFHKVIEYSLKSRERRLVTVDVGSKNSSKVVVTE